MNELKNLYTERRTVLIDKIPFQIPLCICIEPTNICNFKCVMCYHGNNELAEEAKPLCNMDMNTFDKIVSDIKLWVQKDKQKVKLIKLYSLGEPLLNPNVCEMLKKVKDADICDSVEITTNASLMTKDVAQKLVDYGLDIFRVSVYGVEELHSKQITNSAITPQEIYDKVKYLRSYREETGNVRPKIYAKMFRTYTEEDEIFLNMYENIADEIGFDEPFHLNSGENNIFKNMYGEQSEERFQESSNTNLYQTAKACRYPFTHMTVRNDGSIIVCCADWLKELNYGNVHEISLREAWHNKKLYNIRCNMVKTKGQCYSACARCEIPLRDLPEDNVNELDLNKLHYME